MMKDEFSQKKNFQIRKKAKQVQDFRVSTNRRLSLIYQTVKDRKIEESEKVRHLKKVHHYSSIDGRLDAKVFKRDGICAKKITALGNFKNEGKADNKKEMLLV